MRAVVHGIVEAMISSVGLSLEIISTISPSKIRSPLQLEPLPIPQNCHKERPPCFTTASTGTIRTFRPFHQSRLSRIADGVRIPILDVDGYGHRGYRLRSERSFRFGKLFLREHLPKHPPVQSLLTKPDSIYCSSTEMCTKYTAV